MTLFLSLLACSSPSADASQSEVKVGAPAPDFTLPDLDGKDVTLSSFKGKTVVLEWFNPGCPFVVSAHEGGPLETMASTQGDEVVWLAVNSGAPGNQGHGVEANRKAAADWKLTHPILLDEKGDVGHLYGATNTPQMVIIDKEGTVAYYGALDNAPRNQVKGDKRVSWTANALGAVLAGDTPKPAKTKQWGCSVKY